MTKKAGTLWRTLTKYIGPRELDRFDREAMQKAEEKRQRRNAKRLAEAKAKRL